MDLYATDVILVPRELNWAVKISKLSRILKKIKMIKNTLLNNMKAITYIIVSRINQLKFQSKK